MSRSYVQIKSVHNIYLVFNNFPGKERSVEYFTCLLNFNILFDYKIVFHTTAVAAKGRGDRFSYNHILEQNV